MVLVRRCLLLLVGLCIGSFQAFGRPTATVHVGIDRGGPAVGFDYTMPDTKTESFGIYGRLHSEDKDDGAPGLFALGGFFKAHFVRGPYEFYLSPGFGFINYELLEKEVLLGPSLAYGMTAELDTKLAVGIENHKLYSWFGESKGAISDAFLVHLQFKL